MNKPQPQNETVKRHGDKLSGATGGDDRTPKSPDVARTEPPLKAHGDKLQKAVDKASD